MSEIKITATTLPHQPCLAILELKACLLTAIPFLGENYQESNGVLLPRLQWRKNGTFNRHDAGVALDIVLFSGKPKEKALAYALISVFLKYRPLLQWLGLIYENSYVSGRELKVYNYTQDNLHYTHIHLDWFDYNRYILENKQAIIWTAEAFSTNFCQLLKQDLEVVNFLFETSNLDIANFTTFLESMDEPIEMAECDCGGHEEIGG